MPGAPSIRGLIADGWDSTMLTTLTIASDFHCVHCALNIAHIAFKPLLSAAHLCALRAPPRLPLPSFANLALPLRTLHSKPLLLPSPTPYPLLSTPVFLSSPSIASHPPKLLTPNGILPPESLHSYPCQLATMKIGAQEASEPIGLSRHPTQGQPLIKT